MVNDNLALAIEPENHSEEEYSLNWCAIPVSEVIARGARLEATVYDVKERKARAIIENCKCEKRCITGESGIADAYTCARFKRNWVERSDYPIFQPSSILELYPKPDGYIAGNTATNIENLRVHKNQVLVTCSGTIGKVTYVSDTLDGMMGRFSAMICLESLVRMKQMLDIYMRI